METSLIDALSEFTESGPKLILLSVSVLLVFFWSLRLLLGWLLNVNRILVETKKMQSTLFEVDQRLKKMDGQLQRMAQKQKAYQSSKPKNEAPTFSLPKSSDSKRLDV